MNKHGSFSLFFEDHVKVYSILISRSDVCTVVASINSCRAQSQVADDVSECRLEIIFFGGRDMKGYEKISSSDQTLIQRVRTRADLRVVW